MAKSTSSDIYKCSFCGKTNRQVNRLIASAGVYICDECVKVCIEMVQSFKMKNFRTSYLPPPPHSEKVTPACKCSFCGKENTKVQTVIAANGVYICNECVGICDEIIKNELKNENDINL